MMHPRLFLQTAGCLLPLWFFGCPAASTSFAQKIADLRNRVTVERKCPYGSELTLSVKKGDVIRLQLEPNPSGRTEIFLFPREDSLGWFFPSRWGAGKGASGGKRYPHLDDDSFGLGYGIMLNLKVAEGPENKVSLKVLVDDAQKIIAQTAGQNLARSQERLRQQEEERRKANVISLEQRLAGFTRLWSEVKYNFAFFDRMPELNWDKVLEESLPQLLREQTTEEYYRFLERCVARLKDGHTTVYPPPIFQPRGRLPVALQMIGGKPVVAQVAEAAAYAEPRLKPGQEITRIDGRPVEAILEQDVFPYVADSTRQNRDRWALRRLIEGEENSLADVSVREPGGKDFDLKLMRLAWRYPRIPNIQCCDVGEGMIYVALNSFSSQEAAVRFRKKMREILGQQGLIIDVRNNGGGSSHVGYDVVSRLIDKPARGSRWKTRQYMPAFRAWGEKEAWREGEGCVIQPAAEKPFLGPVVVLIGPGTVSAAEDFVVALHAAGRVTLVGEKTAGTTGQPLLIELPRGGRARICTKWDSYPDGREFVGGGVVPDVEAAPTPQSLAAGRDTALEKGIETLAKQTGKENIDTPKLAAQIAVQLRPSSMPAVDAAWKQVQAEYDALAAAYAQKDWKSVGAHADEMSELFRHGSLLTEDLSWQSERLKAEGLLNPQTEYDLFMLKRRQQEINAFFGAKSGSEAVHRLLTEIEDLSDEIHDCLRDRQPDAIPILFPQLEKRWMMLQSRRERHQKIGSETDAPGTIGQRGAA
jgi:carboxyl-terminal processing protease